MSKLTPKHSAPYRHADGSNCWTKDCRLGNTKSDKDELFAQVQKSQATAVLKDPNAATEKLGERLIRPSNLDFDVIAHEVGWIREWEQPWTDAEKKNLETVQKIAELVEHDPFTAADKRRVQFLIDNLEPVVTTRDGGKDNWRARDRMLHSLSEDLLTRRLTDDLTVEPVEEYATNDRLMGLRQAQEDGLAATNRPEYYTRNGTTRLGDVEEHYQEAIARVIRGDEATDLVDNEGRLSLLQKQDRVFSILSPTASDSVHERQLYLSGVFPVNELKKEMDRVGLDNVSVSSFQNGREWGNVYTVITPDGSTRSFSVYEHRNTDSIIINGVENWNGEDLPYAADSKRKFFAEFAPEDKERAAQALTFYMMQAQKGTLNTDEDLVDNATRRDWNAILDAELPGFKEWRQSRITDRYIAPENETEDDILKRLDF